MARKFRAGNYVVGATTKIGPRGGIKRGWSVSTIGGHMSIAHFTRKKDAERFCLKTALADYTPATIEDYKNSRGNWLIRHVAEQFHVMAPCVQVMRKYTEKTHRRMIREILNEFPKGHPARVCFAITLQQIRAQHLENRAEYVQFSD